ncbi:hypothetical protein C463_14640 [Halorubrum californiense DSM 19288]|uniref:Uncharacterized protein n=1 Tax=Halorubrum californiense DSM 19288 TaxID=1227465 RepID=M0E2X5_9EURY|nr:hypothetical protein [Halorubrum californiense]ELZ40689.1 hypothetical protein C463_14640 [Halorubrum californiense DSM 19288]
MGSSDTRSIDELERCVEAIGTTEPAERSADDHARLIDALVALADAYGKRGEFDAEAEMITRLDQLRGRDESNDVAVHLANALANATSVRARDNLYEAAIDPGRIEAYRNRIEELYDPRPEPAIAAPLARATAETIHANGKGNRRDRIEPLLDRLETVYETHSEPDVAAALLRAHAHAELYRGEGLEQENDGTTDVPLGDTDATETADSARKPSDEENRVTRAEEVFRTHPDGDVAAGLAGVLAGRTNADAKRTDIEAIEDRIGRIEALADRYPAQAESITRWLPVATANAARASFEAADISRVEHWASETAAHYEQLSTPSSATWAAVAMFFSARASFFDGDIEAGETKLERLEELEMRYENPVFAHWLARSMFDAARSYVEANESERARDMVEELSEFAVGHQDREEIEAGLEALRSHAPQLFNEPDSSVSEATDAVEVTAGPVAPTDDPDETLGDTHPDDRAPETDSGRGMPDTGGANGGNQHSAKTSATDDDSADAPGCGNCGDDGCGNCGTDADLKEPASGPVLAVVGAAVLIVGFSVVYTLYRVQQALRDTVGSK